MMDYRAVNEGSGWLGGRHMVSGEASVVDNDNADQVTSNK